MERRSIIELAERQHGLVAHAQAMEHGVTSEEWRHMHASGRWTRCTSRVLRRAGAPLTDVQAVLAGVLHVGSDAVATRSTALALWRVTGWELHPVHVPCPGGRYGAAVQPSCTPPQPSTLAT
jgi:hypothetical protein